MNTHIALPRPSIDELVFLARHDFWCFIELAFPVVHPGREIDYAEYLDLMAWLMMEVEAGKYRRVVINLPPRHMKSLIVSIFYVAWRLGRDPTAKFITISYGDDLAHDHSGITRTLMKSPIYGKIFPGTVLDKKAVEHIRTTKGGHRYATSIGSDITGFGADEIIVDDPMQPDDATSELRKERVRSWVQSSVLTRFNDPRKGALILVMHRLAPDDLSETMTAQADYLLKLPLIAEEKEHYARKGKTVMLRQPGDVLNPTRMSASDAAKLKASLARHVWNGQYQQRPTVGGSGMLSIEKFRRYDPDNKPKFELFIHSWDVGATVGGNASVCTKWGLFHDRKEKIDLLYLVDLISIRLELPEVRTTIKAQNQQDRPALIAIDERGVGMGLVQELRREGYRNILGSDKTREAIERDETAVLRPSESKIDRFGKAALVIADGLVLIPTKAPWLERFLYEVAAFPNIPDKDQVDSMTQVIGNFGRAIRMARLYKDTGRGG